MVRQESAKLSCASSNLAGTSKRNNDLPKQVVFSFGEIVEARFEDLNADVRWTSARIRLDGFDTMIFLFEEKKNAANLADIST